MNAGHTPVLLAEGDEVQVLAAASLPLGMFCSTDFASTKRSVGSGSMLLLYSDGMTESTDESGNEYDLRRLCEALLQRKGHTPSDVVEAIHQDIVCYTNGAQPSDDRTMLALRWSPRGV